MNGIRQSWLVAAREMRERSRSRAFAVSVVLMVLTVAGAIALPALLDTGPGTKDVGLTGTVPMELPAAIEAQASAVNTTVRIHRYATLQTGEAAVRDGKVDVLVIDGRQLDWRKRADEQLKAITTGAIQLVAVRERAALAGISPDDLVAMVAPVPVKNVELSQVAGRSPDDETAAFILTILLFGAITSYGAMVLSGVVEEKSSRTVEVLLARMPARNLLAGKIGGIGLLGLAQIALIGLVALVAGGLVDAVDIPAVRGGVIAWAVVWFVLGYALYATVFGTLGSLASRTEDASSVTGPVTVLLVAAFMVSFTAIGSAATTWARLVAWFPVTAPFTMPNRIAMGTSSWWDPLVAVAFTLATIAGLVVLGGRVYTGAILHTGGVLRVGDAWRASRTQSTSPTRPAAPESTKPHGRAPRAPVVALAAGVGVITFVLANDFIIGVAVAAGAYTVAARVLKARSE